MKLNFLKVGFYATMFAMTLFLVSCGGGSESHEGHNHQHQGQEQHDHEGHQHEAGEEQSSIEETGKEYTSAYVCPMHCEGSGSEEAGKCPVCKMDYVKNEMHKH